MSNKKLDEEGFSLLEVIVALAIMAVGFVTVLQLFAGSIRSVEKSEEYLKGITLANHKLNELELIDFETEEFSGQFEGEEDYGWELNIEPYETPLNKLNDNIQIIKINLQVFWNHFGKQGIVELATLRTLGEIYPSTDSVLQGSNKSGIYGKLFGGGPGTITLSGSETEAPPPPPEANASANLSGLPTDVGDIGDISGLRTDSPEAVLSGATTSP